MTEGRWLIPAHAGKTAPRCPPWDPTGAHPRSRGENLGVSGEGFAEAGSSPLTRGKLCVQRRAESLLGLIPAHAGKTKARLETAVRMGAHPRSRGENFAPAFCRATKGGSSPLTRGKRDHERLQALGLGLIPAHAGKTT